MSGPVEEELPAYLLLTLRTMAGMDPRRPATLRAAREAGVTCKALASHFGVSTSRMSQITRSPAATEHEPIPLGPEPWSGGVFLIREAMERHGWRYQDEAARAEAEGPAFAADYPQVRVQCVVCGHRDTRRHGLLRHSCIEHPDLLGWVADVASGAADPAREAAEFYWEPVEPFTDVSVPWRMRCVRCGREEERRLWLGEHCVLCRHPGGVADRHKPPTAERKEYLAERKAHFESLRIEAARRLGWEPQEPYPPKAYLKWTLKCQECGRIVKKVVNETKRPARCRHPGPPRQSEPPADPTRARRRR